MKIYWYAASFVILLIITLIYQEKKNTSARNKDYKVVNKYLVTDHDINKSDLPIIWIHMTYKENARWWESWGSRLTDRLNQPYLHLSIKSIIDKCGGNFNICIINDDSFSKLLPNWQIDLSRVSEPLRSKLVKLGKTKLLYEYGGIIIPPSFLCMKNLIDMYNRLTLYDKAFVGEVQKASYNPTTNLLQVSDEVMGANRHNSVVKEYMIHLEHLASRDYTDESIFTGEDSGWLSKKVDAHELNKIEAPYLGVIDSKDELVTLERFMDTKYIDFKNNIVGVLLPANELLERTSYSWFARMSIRQVLECNNNLGKLLLITR